MAYYEDLTSRTDTRDGRAVVMVRWLDAGHKYSVGKAEPVVLRKLLYWCQRSIYLTRGFHPCAFCAIKVLGAPVIVGGEDIKLGSAEIRIPGDKGVVYAAPDLIYHYVHQHGYQPPKEFIEALVKT